MDMEHQILEPDSYFVLIISGVFGVVIKNGLQETFGPQMEQPFKQIPANMVGCFLVGFLASSSSTLQIALGSVTSLALWNQAMVSSALHGNWFFALCSLVAGLELAYISYKIGLDSKVMLHHALGSRPLSSGKFKHGRLATAMIASSLCLLVSGLFIFDGSSNSQRRRLWLACLLAPQGVWLRQTLSSTLNDRYSNLPLGTWIANLASSLAVAALQLIKIETTDPAGVGLALDAFQQGLIDSMGTISTVVAQAHSLHATAGKGKAWRAYSYVLSTMVTCALVAAIIPATSILRLDNAA